MVLSTMESKNHALVDETIESSIKAVKQEITIRRAFEMSYDTWHIFGQLRFSKDIRKIS